MWDQSKLAEGPSAPLLPLQCLKCPPNLRLFPKVTPSCQMVSQF